MAIASALTDQWRISYVSEVFITLVELPEIPAGWTKRLEMHLNYGKAGGAATYSVFDDMGRKTNIGYAYDTRGEGESGFFIHGSELMPWNQLRARYAELLKLPANERKGASSAGGDGDGDR
jgi:hypothetical protein